MGRAALAAPVVPADQESAAVAAARAG